MSNPVVGEILYDSPDPDTRSAVLVVHTHATTVWYVPVGTELRSTHQGNLYDEFGQRKHMV